MYCIINAIMTTVESRLQTHVDEMASDAGAPEILTKKKPLVSQRAHDLKKTPHDRAWITTYPISKLKQREGREVVQVTLSVDVVVSLGQVKASDVDKINTMLDITQSIDDYMEGGEESYEPAVIVINDDDTDLWLPDFINRNALFLGVIPLKFRWKRNRIRN